jgi:hypothetical protein
MPGKSGRKKRFCGNCGYHTVYDYPKKIFCARLLAKNKNPVVDTLWCCGEWNQSSQECFCVEEATNKRNTK